MPDGEQRALERVVPAGLVIRTEVEEDEAGPYRRSARATTIIEAPRRRGRQLRVPFAIAGSVLPLALVLAGDYQLAVVMAIAIAGSVVGTRHRAARIAISDDRVLLSDNRSVSLADVRKVEVVQRRDDELNRDVACVVVHAQRTEIELVRLDEPRQAEYVARLVDEAYRAFLRRQG